VSTVAVVLCWNDSARVVALLGRLRALEVGPDAVVVVDNGSEAGHRARIEAAYPQHEVVRLGSNRGFAAAVNRGVERALAGGAEWVWLLNSDVELPANALAALRAVACESTGMVGAVLIEGDGSVQAWGGGCVNVRTGSSRHAVSASDPPNYLSAACLLLRAAMLGGIGLFDEDFFFYWEDVDLGFRAREAGWVLRVASDCRVVHAEGSTLGRWSSARWELLFRGMTRFLRRRSPAPALAVSLRLVVHTVTMLRHGRAAAVAGAWRGVFGHSERAPLVAATERP
jgi:hypothetical protein